MNTRGVESLKRIFNGATQSYRKWMKETQTQNRLGNGQAVFSSWSRLFGEVGRLISAIFIILCPKKAKKYPKLSSLTSFSQSIFLLSSSRSIWSCTPLYPDPRMATTPLPGSRSKSLFIFILIGFLLTNWRSGFCSALTWFMSSAFGLWPVFLSALVLTTKAFASGSG